MLTRHRAVPLADRRQPHRPRPVGSSARRGPLPSHDWRAAGFVSLVGGRLYDPYCRPFRSVGSNVPNLMFREGLRENLEWMRRAPASLAAGGRDRPRPAAAGHAAGCRSGRRSGSPNCCGRSKAFNAAHPPNESIYVMVALTDYYEPGVPGDQYGFDHAGWCNARVLNAPWYRRGVHALQLRTGVRRRPTGGCAELRGQLQAVGRARRGGRARRARP